MANQPEPRRGRRRLTAGSATVAWPIDEDEPPYGHPDAPRACGANGGGYRGVGFLLDAAGTDRYEDPLVPGGSCQDCTLVPKGLVGAQVDRPVDSDDA